MSVIKLEVPADNALALSAAASFFMQLAGLKQATVAQAVSHSVESAGDFTTEQIDQVVAAIDNATAAAADSDDTDDQPSNGEGLDSAGLPWDKRIHSGAKTKIKKTGTWKPLRGVDSALVAQVEAELRQNMAPEVPDPKPSAQLDAPAADAPQSPALPDVPTSTAAAAAPAVSAMAIGFPDLMKIYAPMRVKNPGIEEEAKAWCIAQGLTGLPGLAVNAELRPAFKAFLESKQ